MIPLLVLLGCGLAGIVVGKMAAIASRPAAGESRTALENFVIGLCAVLWPMTLVLMLIYALGWVIIGPESETKEETDETTEV